MDTTETHAMRAIPLFADLSDEDLEAVSQVGHPRSFSAGEAIVEQGTKGDAMYVMLGGRAEVDVGGRFHVLKAGDFFGEMALLDGGPRTATVTSTTPIKLYALTEWVFRGLLVEHPTIAMRTLETMAARLRGATKVATA